MQINEVLRHVTAFLRELSFSPSSVDMTQSFISFKDGGLGSMLLTGKERDDYIGCVDKLVSGFDKAESFSRTGLERLFRTAILKAGQPQPGTTRLREKHHAVASRTPG